MPPTEFGPPSLSRRATADLTP